VVPEENGTLPLREVDLRTWVERRGLPWHSIFFQGSEASQVQYPTGIAIVKR
jgi:hypothetical protein